MELKDNCAICRISMTRHAVQRTFPCRHLFHVKCFQQIQNLPVLCPMCRTEVTGRELIRKHYNRHSEQDRKRIVKCANGGKDWVTLASTLGVKYKTAFHWVRSGRGTMLNKGGVKPKILTEGEIDIIISWIEAECELTLKKIHRKISDNFEKEVAISTIGNYLDGRSFTIKQVHREPCNMNSNENKQKRGEYIQKLNRYIQQGKQVGWIDETNFNLFCRRTRGRALAGSRATQCLPAARGPNVHLIGAISAAGVVTMERRRGSFTAELANMWASNLLQRWQNMGNELSDLVMVCDNAPCHSALEAVFINTEATLLRLAPYSPMLNPIEAIWSKIKSYVKAHLRVPQVEAPGVGEQRLIYLEQIIDDARDSIVGGDCARASQHSTTHHAAVLALEDIAVGR